MTFTLMINKKQELKATKSISAKNFIKISFLKGKYYRRITRIYLKVQLCLSEAFD